MCGWTLTVLGAFDEAVGCLEHGLAAAERDATEGNLVRCLGHLSWACARRGEHDRATALAERAESLLGGVTGGAFLHGTHAVLALAEARLALGDADAAGRVLPATRRSAAEAGWVELQAWADLLLGRCRWASGDPAGAARLAGAALALAGRVELPGIAWQAHALLAGLPDRDDAAGHRAAATAILDDLADSLDDDLRSTFRTHVDAFIPT